ncbi:MAG: hypothetical protein GY758_33925 [Fuerstiella sp.]|nr:hypothetical protein [Fuerstiella sp.]
MIHELRREQQQRDVPEFVLNQIHVGQPLLKPLLSFFSTEFTEVGALTFEARVSPAGHVTPKRWRFHLLSPEMSETGN